MHIARECGILTDDDHVALEGPVFRKMYEVRVNAVQSVLRKGSFVHER